MNPQPITELQSRRDMLIQQITELGDFRPGRLYSTFRRCGRPGCHCAQPDSAGHGPYWILTRKGKDQRSVSHNVPHGAVEQTRAQLQLYERFRDLTHELVEVNDALCQMKLRERAVQKKTSHRRTSKHSRSRSPPKRSPKC